ncbi:dihydroorotase [Thermococcus sp.]|uniref:dihydroorotase n=1 Tax=Thermococcus sp. TaxID=35749 RepID=UPI00261577DB|nr:dihydroorotase [Thermococcus sp.]
MHELVIEGRFFYFGKLIKGGIAVDEKKISAISTGSLKGERTVRLRRKEILLPGLIDTHVHLRDFEERKKETVESGTMAAVHGGLTAVFDMPNTRPPVDDGKTFRKRLRSFTGRAYSNYALGFLVAGNCSEAMKAGADFYKIFMAPSTGGLYSENFEEDYSCSPGAVSVHAEDADILKADPTRPPEAEVKAVRRALNAARRLKKPINICHISTGEALRELVNSRLPRLSFEVTPHHLLLTKKDYRRNPMLKVYPPLRPEADRRVLWKNLPRIPIIASDHAPHTIEDKAAGAAGIPGLETEVALLLDAVNRGLMELGDIVEKMHSNPVRFFGIAGVGLRPGAWADFTVVDIGREWVVKPEDFYSKARWSPWEGRRLRGKVSRTVIRGEVVMEDDEIVSKAVGVRLDVEGGGHKGDL